MGEDIKETEQIDYRKLLVFSIGERKYSIDADNVDEIVNDIEVFPLPFVPETVEGVINLRGQPVTVYNPFLSSDFKGVKNSAHCNILKFKSPDEAFGIKISCVESFSFENEIKDIEELNMRRIKADLRKALGYEKD